MHAPAELAEITPAALAARFAAGDRPVLVDVREPHEWDIVNLAEHGARLIPLSQVGDRLGDLDPSQEIVVHCKMGGRSARAARQLQEAGFHRVLNMTGGILAWSDEVDPAKPKY